MITITLTDNNALILKHCIKEYINSIDASIRVLKELGNIDADIISLYNKRTTLLFILKNLTNTLEEVKK